MSKTHKKLQNLFKIHKKLQNEEEKEGRVGILLMIGERIMIHLKD